MRISNVVWRNGWACFVGMVNGRRIWRSLRTRLANVARERAAEMRWRLSNGEDPLAVRRAARSRGPEPTLGELLERYEAGRGQELRPNTLGRNRRRFLAFAAWAKAHGAETASAVTAELLVAYRVERARRASAVTAASDLRPVATVLRYARRMRWTLAEPFLDLPRQPRPAVAEKPVARWSNIEAALEASRGQWFFEALAIAALAGLRRGEAAHLRWEDVDFERREIHIVNRPGEFAVKTSDARTVPMAAWLAEHLPRRRTGRVCPFAADALSHATHDTLVASGVHGGIHGLRHSWITMMLLGGSAVAQVMAWAGHSNLSTTDGYTHVRQAIPKADVEAFRRAVFGASL